MKGFYIYYGTKNGYLGVDKKVDDQVRFMSQYIDIEKITIPKKKTNLFMSILWRMPFGSFGREYDIADCLVKDADIIYIRFVPVDLQFLNFIRQLRKNNEDAKIILEIATYPYAGELLRKKDMIPFFFKDLIYHRFLKKYVNKIVTYSNDSKIYGIPTIQIKNGIDVNNIKMTTHRKKKDEDVITIIAVANFQKTHGYERCIKSLSQYYLKGGKRKIKIIFVGSGAELQYYKRLTTRLKLTKNIVFTGKKSGSELYKIYESADIALGTFGMYKTKLKKSSSLKIREYLSQGIPVVSACREDIFENSSPFFYKQLEDCSNEFDFKTIIQFYDKIYNENQDKDTLRRKIREYAVKNVDISVTFKPVIEYMVRENDGKN